MTRTGWVDDDDTFDWPGPNIPSSEDAVDPGFLRAREKWLEVERMRSLERLAQRQRRMRLIPLLSSSMIVVVMLSVLIAVFFDRFNLGDAESFWFVTVVPIVAAITSGLLAVATWRSSLRAQQAETETRAFRLTLELQDAWKDLSAAEERLGELQSELSVLQRTEDTAVEREQAKGDC